MEAVGGEGAEVEGGVFADNKGCEDFSGDGREHNAVAIVAGGYEVSGPRGCAEEWTAVGGAGAKASPDFVDAHGFHGRNNFSSSVMEVLDDFGIHILVEAGFF